jgi:hypothetical protein
MRRPNNRSGTLKKKTAMFSPIAIARPQAAKAPKFDVRAR